MRDLHGLVLLAHLLAQRGHEAVLMPFYAQSFELALVRPDLLVLNYARPANLGLIRHAQACGVRLAVLDTEGGLLPEDGPTSPRGMADFMKTSGLDQALDLYMFWGTDLRNRIVAATSLPPGRAVVTGCPRFDLAHRPWVQSARDRNAVLVNTNFPVANTAHATGTALDHAAMRAMGFADEQIAGLVSMIDRIMHGMIAAVTALARARPTQLFVLRPHPFERAAPYIEAFAALPNVVVEQQGNVLDALAQARCLLHVNCTTAIEAAACGVPPISLDFINEPDMLRMAALPTQVSHRAASLEQALAMIDNAGTLSLPEQSGLVEPHFGPADGQAATRAADAILATLARPAAAVPGAPNSPASKRILGMAGGMLGSATIERLRQAHRPVRRSKAFGAAEVAAMLQRFGAAQNVSPARVRRLRTRHGLPLLSLSITADRARAVATPPAPTYRPAPATQGTL